MTRCDIENMLKINTRYLRNLEDNLTVHVSVSYNYTIIMYTSCSCCNSRSKEINVLI